MFIVKYLKSEYIDRTISGESIRIGTFKYFRNIEDSSLVDKNEGAGKFLIHGNKFSTDLLNPFLVQKLPEDFIIEFEAGKGTLIIDDVIVNMFVFCTTYVDDIEDIEKIRKRRFMDKDSYLCIADENTFIEKCSQNLLHQIRINHPDEIKYIYNWSGKVDYTDFPKKTDIDYNDFVQKGLPLALNLRLLFEKPVKYEPEQEFRFVWIITNKPIESDHGLYSIEQDYCDVQIEPNGCISKDPIEFISSPKSISVWDLLK